MKNNKYHKPVPKRVHDKGKKSTVRHDRKWAEHHCECGYDVTLPWWSPYVVTLLTMVVRVSYVIDRRSWWILHPDEVYQTVEGFKPVFNNMSVISRQLEHTNNLFLAFLTPVPPFQLFLASSCYLTKVYDYQPIVGFSLVSGYGFRSYEYLPAPTNTNISIETQILNSGMHSMRSFILPYIFAAAIWTAKLVGCKWSSFLYYNRSVSLMYSMRSVLLPYIFAAVIRTAKLVGCKWSSFLIGRVFNTIISSTLPLAVFKFVYVIFRCRLIALLSCALTATSLHLAVLGTHPLVNSFTAPFIVSGLAMCLKSICLEITDSHPTELGTPSEHSEVSDFNANVLEIDVDNVSHIQANGKIYKNGNGFLLKGERRQHSVESRKKLKYEQAEIVDTRVESDKQTQQFTSRIMVGILPYFGGALLGLTSYVRPDTVVFIVAIFVPLAFALETKIIHKVKLVVFTCLGGISSLFLCVVDDFNRYGLLVFSPVQWFKFNVISTKAGIIFGSDTVTSYLDVLMLDKCSFLLFICAIVTLFLISFIKYVQSANTKSAYALVGSFVLMLSIFSLVGHKEVKIIHNLFILQSIITALAIHFIVIYAISLQWKQIFTTISVLSIISICAINSYQSFPYVETSASEWSYKDPKDSRDVNSCLDFIRKQNDVHGVMINSSVYNFGGYSILEHDVPILVMVHQEYHLYETKKRNRLGENNRIRVFTDFSDFVDMDNQLYVFKVIRNENLNYAISITSTRKHYEYIGYKIVFKYGGYSVFKKSKMGSGMSTGELSPLTTEDPNIIEYEANWLITNGLYTKAIWRINRALEISRKLRHRPRVRLYQLLFVCHGKMNQIQKLKFYQDECFNIYGRNECVTPQEKIVRHNEYSRFY